MNTPYIAQRAQLRLHVLIFAILLLADQLTKLWARARFSLPNGEPDYAEHIAVLGEWLHLRLVYNTGAAFGLRPQEIAPFLHPMAFFGILTSIAIVFFAVYYRRLGPGESTARLGVLLILTGAFGNFIDRMALHRVTDFIDAGIPGVFPRWPVFNVADSAVTVGIVLLFLAPLLRRKPREDGNTPAPDAPPHGG
jgi:signal peptidase II